jgi:hypothetical protein
MYIYMNHISVDKTLQTVLQHTLEAVVNCGKRIIFV